MSCCLVQLRRHAQFLGISGIVVAASLFWSPLVAIGLLPLVAGPGYREWRPSLSALAKRAGGTPPRSNSTDCTFAERILLCST